MHIIQPVTVTSARLTASNVPETDYDEWLIGTAYTAGDNCIVIGTTHKIYEALVDVTGGDSPEIDVLNDVPKWLEISA
ncbi:MAG: carbohydrate-binding protein, partial [Gammaproteobacteria bacterium]|nr:carbohydrate-binding protein [Gammaproteobacteria bacterium]